MLAIRWALVCMLAAPMMENAAAQGVMPLTQSFSFGMVALGADQVARLSVVNIAPAIGMQPCPVEMTFLDGQGVVLKSAKLHIEAQKAGFLEIERSEAAGAGARVQIRATYTVTMPGVSTVYVPGSICTLAPTLEIYSKVSGLSVLVLTDAKTVPLAAQRPGTSGRP